MTLARADAGAPTATQAPIMAAETERLIVWTIDVIDFLLLKLMLNCRANPEQMTLETGGDFGRRPFSSAGSSAGVPCTLAPRDVGLFGVQRLPMAYLLPVVARTENSALP